MNNLIEPHGGVLVQLLASPERAAEIQSQSRDWSSWDLSERQLCDLELLLTGGFSPLQSFMGRRDYESVCASMRLASGQLWPIPVVLDLPEVVPPVRENEFVLRERQTRGPAYALPL